MAEAGTESSFKVIDVDIFHRRKPGRDISDWPVDRAPTPAETPRSSSPTSSLRDGGGGDALGEARALLGTQRERDMGSPRGYGGVS